MELYQLTAHEARDLLRRGDISATELTRAVLQRITAVEPRVKAYITLTPEVALAQAAEADKRFAEARRAGTVDQLPDLLGIPLAVKDVISTAGIRTTCASKILDDYVPPYDATAVVRLREQGAVIVGKTNTDEFAMGWSTENSAFGPSHNPWDLSRVPGGSSGGNAAALAADATIIAIGSDTGGSVRQPAAFCNLVALRPTYGRVSRFGLVAFASSLDQIGPMTKDVTDAALVYQAIAGHDPKDSTSVNRPVEDVMSELGREVKGLRVGVPKEYFGEGIDPNVARVVRQALSVLEDLGAHLEEISLPLTQHSIPVYYIIAPAEASANLARYDGVRYGYRAEASTLWEQYKRTRGQGFGPEVKRRIILGTYALSAGYYDAYYLRAQKVRTLIRREYEKAFEQVDVIAGPVTPVLPWPIGWAMENPVQAYLTDLLTISQAIAGVPAMAVPAGFWDDLPVGLQLVGRPFDEPTLFRLAYAYEQATGWGKRRPATL
ncbi:MAG: Asp-tRNA(Asn)/Glu-tRNA(Gln) amidotransferase subunit GatA [Chloroflexi bacterium]|nr:Asp-tRNA(Asn)/Glu-tRNA(Gln) amidotransferase subunit GatA [Chloroflexota bacterium]